MLFGRGEDVAPSANLKSFLFVSNLKKQKVISIIYEDFIVQETIIVYELDSIKKKNRKHEMHTGKQQIARCNLPTIWQIFCHLSPS